MIDKEPRAIRELEKNANDGSLLSIAQLIQYHYKEGLKIDFDKYSTQFIDILNKSNFSLDHIQLKNIKRLKEFDLNLDPQLTIIIGENAVGKTTICESIAKFSSWMAAKIQQNKNGYSILKNDITIGENSAKIIGQLNLYEKNSLSYQLIVSPIEKGSYKEINLVGEILRNIEEKYPSHIEYPIFAFFSIDRVQAIQSKSPILDNIRTEAYENSLREKTDIGNIEEWYIRVSNADKSKYFKAITDLNSKLSTFEQKSKEISKLNSPEKIEDFEEQLNELLERFSMMESIALQQQAIAEKQLKKLESLEGSHIAKSDISNTKIQNLLEKTIQPFFKDFINLYVDYPDGRPTLFLKFKWYDITFNQLSHGQRSIVNMIFDLIRRVVILNPQMEDPRKCNGIVIIDEIELHLHPSWQQVIVNNLCECFPNIQFIITTHSPMVLQSKYIKKSNIRILKENDDGQIIATPPSAQGLSVNDILLDVFGVSVVEDNESSQKVRLMKKMIDESTYETQEGIELYTALTKRFGANSHVIKELNELIEFNKLFE